MNSFVRTLFVSLLIFSASFTGLSATASGLGERGGACLALFAPMHQRLNPTATLDSLSYTLPNHRGWRQYHYLLGSLWSPRAGSQVLDLGGGTGVAMRELARRGVQATVINTQDFSMYAIEGLKFRTGWAEDILPTLEDASFDSVYDVYGAFFYSTLKPFILEQVYRILKPGGEARLLFDFVKSPAVVDGVRLDTWLLRKFPGVISTKEVYLNGRAMTVIILTKARPRWWHRSTPRFELGLKILKADANPALSFAVPRVSYTADLNVETNSKK